MIVAADNILCKLAAEWKKVAWSKYYGTLCKKEETRPLVLAHWYRNLIPGATAPGFDLVETSLQEDCTNLDNDVLDPIEDLVKRVERDVINDIGSDVAPEIEYHACNITYTNLSESPTASCSGITITHNVIL
jgi:hypothetical protein